MSILHAEKLIKMYSVGNIDSVASLIADDFFQIEQIMILFLREIDGLEFHSSSELSDWQMNIWQTLQMGFDELRMAVERERPRAMAIMERLQAIIARDVIRKNKGPASLIFLQILNEASVEILPVLRRAINETPVIPFELDNSAQTNALLQGREMLNKLVKSNAGDSYAIASALLASIKNLPAESRFQSLLMTLSLSQEPCVRELAGIFCIDKDAIVRKSFLKLLADAGANLGTGVTLRRLIGMRNWLPEIERPLVDFAVKSLKLAGAECAPLQAVELCKLVSYSVDGSGGWGFLGCLKSHSGASVFGFISRVNYGIRDAWIHNQVSKSEYRHVEIKMKATKEFWGSLSVNAAVTLLNYAIATGLKEGRVPSSEVLQLSEILGHQVFQNPESAFENALDKIRARVDCKSDFKSYCLEVVLADRWSKFPIFESWFEDDTVVDNIVCEALGKEVKKWNPDSKCLAAATQRVFNEVVVKRNGVSVCEYWQY